MSDPETVQKEVYFDTLLDAQIANLIQMQQAQSQMALQQEQMMMQMQAQQQQQGMEGLQQQAAGAPGGNGFDPNQGGLPPQMAAPEATREGVTGIDLEGNPTATGLGGI